jgi:hypothetical protein
MSQGAPVDADAFVNEGFVVIRGAFPRSVAVEVLECLDSRPSSGSGDSWTNEHLSVYDMPVLAAAVTDPGTRRVRRPRWHGAMAPVGELGLPDPPSWPHPTPVAHRRQLVHAPHLVA